MKKMLGYLYKGIGTIIDYFLRLIILIVNTLVTVFSSFRQLFAYILSMGGCLLLVFFISPIGIYTIFRNPVIVTLIVLSILIPIIGKIAVSYLKYIHYMITEYFYDKADHLILGRKASYDNFKGYGDKYRKDQEEARRKAEEERRKKEEEEWKKRFEQSGGRYYTFEGFSDFEDFFRNINSGAYQGYGQYQGSQQGYNPGYSSFDSQYESACNTLGVSTNADKYEIKLQYKKMAKKYHPDLNKEPGATEKFQEINNAYSFLTDENIERYKRSHSN